MPESESDGLMSATELGESLGFTVVTETSQHVVAGERWYTTADGRLVSEGHLDTTALFCTPGVRLEVDVAREAGLVEG